MVPWEPVAGADSTETWVDFTLGFATVALAHVVVLFVSGMHHFPPQQLLILIGQGEQKGGW
jgi:hypothetical protein